MTKTKSLMAAGIGLAMSLSACGDGDSGQANADTSGDAGPTQLTIQTSPVSDYAGAFVCIEEGVFEEHGLEVTHEIGQSGAATVASVMSGTIPIGASAVTPIITAATQNVPVRLFAPGATARDEGEDYIALVAAAGEGIQSPADLEGKTVAVNALKAFLELSARMAIREDGGDDSGVSFIEVPFPEMTSAIERGQVDAAVTIEPFLNQAEEAGLEVVGYPNRSVTPNMLVSSYFTSAQYAQENPEVVSAFADAIEECHALIEENPDRAREIIAEYTGLEVAELENIVLPKYVPRVEEDSLASIADAMVDVGFIEEAPELQQYYWSGTG